MIAVLRILSNAQLNIRLQKLTERCRNKRNVLIFDHQYLESKAFYLYRFKTVPNLSFMDDIDVTAAFTYIQSNLKNNIVDIYQNCVYNRMDSIQQFNKTIFVLSNKVMIELGGQYAEILYPPDKHGFADNLLKALSIYKQPEKKQDFEINIITFSNGSLELKPFPVNPTLLDLDLYYNSDFKTVDDLICDRLNQQNDKGIVLLHGLPGTGKTTYLRYLIGKIKKRVLFLSPSVAGNLMNPDFIELLIDNPNTVLIIEDAENIIMDRKLNSGSAVSNLLNISDGLLADFLNVQLICTFNSAVSMIDSALMRKGRLIAKYEFGKLGIEKAQQLSNHFGFDTLINRPMTIAEIANQHEREEQSGTEKVIGFRRASEMVN